MTRRTGAASAKRSRDRFRLRGGFKPDAVTRRQAQQALEDFIANRLPDFGRYEDAVEWVKLTITTLYWDFLMRHEERLRKNTRMLLQVKNLARLDAATRSEICRQGLEIIRNEVTLRL